MIFRGHKSSLIGGAIVDVGTYERDNGETFAVHISRSADEDWPIAGDNGASWFILGFCFATALRENLTFQHHVDASLARNLRSQSEQWSRWFRPIRPVSFVGIIEEDIPLQTVGACASLYSGGIDSLHTVQTRVPSIEVLISVEHQALDELAINNGLDRLLELSSYATETGRRQVRLVTNAMSVLPEINDLWSHIYHGSVYFALASYLGGLASTTLSSSQSYGKLISWGSHPLTDVLLSSRSMRAEHYGATFTRIEKTASIATDDVALGVLSVCGKGRLSGHFVNCSRCQKCLRTMGTFDLLNVDRLKAKTFDWESYAPDKLGRVFLKSISEVMFYKEIADYANRIGRLDIERACDIAIRRSRMFSVLSYTESFIRLRYPMVLRYKPVFIAFRDAVYHFLGLRRLA